MSHLKLLLVITVIFISQLILGQNRDENALKYGATITNEELKEHLSILASDDFLGRETGEIGEDLAAFYLAGQFASLSIPPIVNGSYFQRFPLEKFQPTGVASSEGKSFEILDDFVYFKASGNEFEINEMVFCGFGVDSKNYNDYTDVDVKGKSVFVMGGDPTDKKGISYKTGEKAVFNPRTDIFGKYGVARRKGAKHIFIVYENYDDVIKPFLHFFGSEKIRLLNEDFDKSDETMLFIISRPMAEVILANSKKGIDEVKDKINKKGTPESFTFPTSLKMNTIAEGIKTSGKNVLGYIEGSDLKNEVVVITAHYDHIGADDGKIYNGADDDGSGTVGLIEIAEAFAQAKKDGHGPRRSILIMPVSGEEKGLLGSKYYTDNPVFTLENTVANLNIDMIGRIDDEHIDNPDYIYLIGSDMLSNELHDISEQANKTYVGLHLDYRYNSLDDPNNFYQRSDHYNFAKNNIPVIFYFNGTHADYHKSTDTIEKIDFERLESRTRLVFYTAWELANRDERPKLNQ